MRLLTHKIETHDRYTHKINDKIEKDWITSFHISNIVKLEMIQDPKKELIDFELNEDYFLRYFH